MWPLKVASLKAQLSSATKDGQKRLELAHREFNIISAMAGQKAQLRLARWDRVRWGCFEIVLDYFVSIHDRTPVADDWSPMVSSSSGGTRQLDSSAAGST